MAHSQRGWTGARTPSAIKRVRQNSRRKAINQPRRSAAKTLVTKAVLAASNGDAEQTPQALAEALSALDRAAKVGAIHKNAAARRKSRLMLKVSAAMGGSDVVSTAKTARTTGKAASVKEAKARIAAGKATKAKGAQTAAGKARAALARSSREATSETAAPKAEATTPTRSSATKPAAKSTATKATTAKATASKTTAKPAASKTTAKAPTKETAKPRSSKTTKSS